MAGLFLAAGRGGGGSSPGFASSFPRLLQDDIVNVLMAGVCVYVWLCLCVFFLGGWCSPKRLRLESGGGGGGPFPLAK